MTTQADLLVLMSSDGSENGDGQNSKIILRKERTSPSSSQDKK